MIEDSFEFKVRPGSPFSLSTRSPSVDLGGASFPPIVVLPVSPPRRKHRSKIHCTAFHFGLLRVWTWAKENLPTHEYLFSKKNKMSAL